MSQISRFMYILSCPVCPVCHVLPPIWLECDGNHWILMHMSKLARVQRFFCHWNQEGKLLCSGWGWLWSLRSLHLRDGRTLTGCTNKHPDIMSFSCGKRSLICSSRICSDCCVDLPMEEKAITRTPLFQRYLIKCAPLPCPSLSIVNHQNNLSVRMYVWNDTELANKDILKLEAV